MTGNSALVGGGAAPREDAVVRPGADPERVVQPVSSIAPAPEVEGELALPGTGSKALVKSFISNRSFETLSVLARFLVAAPEFPEALRNETLKALDGIKTKEQREIISDALKSYKPYTSRLPKGGAEEVATWCQDRGQHHNLYTILGTTVALASILSLDQTLPSRVIATRLGEEAPRVLDDLNNRLLSHYQVLFGGPTSVYANVLAAEGDKKNPLAVTLFLKGFLAPLLEFERPVKRGLFGFLSSTWDEVNAPTGLENICDRPWTTRMASDLSKLLAAIARTEEAAKRAREQEEEKLGLKGIKSVQVIDKNFIQKVLATSATPSDKLLFLTSAVALATTVDESAIIELVEKTSELKGVSLRGSPTETQQQALHDLIKKIVGQGWSSSDSDCYGPPMLVLALSKCSGLRNPAYASVVQASFTSHCDAWYKKPYRDDFKADVCKLISHLVSEAVKKGVNLPAS